MLLVFSNANCDLMSYKTISISFQNINGLFERVGKTRSYKLLKAVILVNLKVT